jgi:hypothetical protein
MAVPPERPAYFGFLKSQSATPEYQGHRFGTVGFFQAAKTAPISRQHQSYPLEKMFCSGIRWVSGWVGSNTVSGRSIEP